MCAPPTGVSSRKVVSVCEGLALIAIQIQANFKCARFYIFFFPVALGWSEEAMGKAQQLQGCPPMDIPSPLRKPPDPVLCTRPDPVLCIGLEVDTRVLNLPGNGRE